MPNTLTVWTWDLVLPRPSRVLVTNPDRQLPCHFSKTVLQIPSTLPLPAFAGTESIRRALPTVAAWNMAVRFGLSYHKEASAGQTVEKMLKAFWSPLCLKRTNLPEDRAEGEPWMILAFSRGERGRIGGFGAKEQMFAQDNTLQTFAYNKEILPKAGGLEQFKGEKKE